MDTLTQVGLFLDYEDAKIKKYTHDLLTHYVYKRIFNLSNKYYEENKDKYLKDDITFKENFQNYVAKQFDLKNYVNFKTFSNELLNAILSNTKPITKRVVNGRPNPSETKAMRYYAEEEGRTNCYLCGVETKNKNEKNNIDMKTWNDENQSQLIQKLMDKNKQLLEEHNKKIINHVIFTRDKIKKILLSLNWLDINHQMTWKDYYFQYKVLTKKVQYDFSNLNTKVTNSLFSKISLNECNKEFKEAYSFYNNNIMKIEHCFAVDWGGGKNEKNLFISCHKCNQDKSNITFFTEYSINKFFINEFEPNKAKKAFQGTLGQEALISLKVEQEFHCSNCDKELSDTIDFYLARINEEDGYHYLNTQITCKDCIITRNQHRILDIDEFLKEYIKL